MAKSKKLVDSEGDRGSEGDYSDLDAFILTEEETDALLASGQVDQGDYLSRMASTNLQASRMASDEALRLANQNYGVYRQSSQVAMEEAVIAGQGLQDAANEAFYSALDYLSPTWREDIVGTNDLSSYNVSDIANKVSTELYPELVEPALELYKKGSTSVASMLAGEVPDDVYKELQKSQAETLQAFGVFGESAGSASSASLATQLGLTSLDMINQGISSMSALSSAASSALGLGSTAAQVAGLGQTAALNSASLFTSLSPTQVDYSSLYSSGMSTLAGANLVPATTAYDMTRASMDVANQQVLSNAAMEQANQVSLLNYELGLAGATATIEAAEYTYND